MASDVNILPGFIPGKSIPKPDFIGVAVHLFAGNEILVFPHPKFSQWASKSLTQLPSVSLMIAWYLTTTMIIMNVLILTNLTFCSVNFQKNLIL